MIFNEIVTVSSRVFRRKIGNLHSGYGEVSTNIEVETDAVFKYLNA